MQRTGETTEAASIRQFSISSSTGYFRLGYNISIRQGYILEPILMLVKFYGEMEQAGQSDATSVGSASGKEQILDVGFNLFFNPDLKLSVHYTYRNGDAGYAGNGAAVNNYFFQSGVGPIHRGNWLGVGWVFIF